MEVLYTVSLSKLMKEVSLEGIYMPCNPEEILISSPDVNRSGLELNGFLDFFDEKRIQMIGNTETALLSSFSKERKEKAIEEFFLRKPPAIIFARGIQPLPEIMVAAEKYKIPLLGTEETTSSMLAALVTYMNAELAPRITRHGVMVEVYGEGILMIGDSGVGKSETAIELIKRGHRLIADDAVEIRRVSAKSLVGSAPENIRHFVELRGIGIVNARRIFGMSAIKMTEKIDMCVNLEIWDNTKVYDRMGTGNEYTEILGIKVPVTTIPVKPGRNLAIIIEVAAMNNRQKKMGYDATQELLASLGMDINMIQAQEKIREINF